MMLDASIVQYYCLKVDQIYKGLTLPVDLMGGGGCKIFLLFYAKNGG